MNSETTTTQPLISVVMPAYNAEQTIQESINSVINQTYTNWEILIIDDKSIDNTSQIIKQAAVKSSRIRIFAHLQNKGVAASRNKGIKEAKGSYIAFLDSDDLWHPNKLIKQLAFMKKNNAAISYTATAYMKDDTRSRFILRAEKQLNRKNLLKNNIMSCSSVMVKNEIIRNNLFPEQESLIHEDFTSWLNILKDHGCAYGLDEPLLTYRISGSSKSASRVTSAIMIFNAYHRAGYNMLKSLLLTLQYIKHSITKRYMIKVGF